jgi:hypothetical protein
MIIKQYQCGDDKNGLIIQISLGKKIDAKIDKDKVLGKLR